MGTALVTATRNDVVIEAVNELTARYTAFEKHLYASRKLLWAVVGRIYELSHQIDADEKLKAMLLSYVRQAHPKISGSRNFQESEIGSAALLLIGMLGYGDDTKAKRSQYLAAIKAAKSDQSLERTESAFVHWIEQKSGLRNAAKLIPASNESQDTYRSNLDLNVALVRHQAINLPVLDISLPDEVFSENIALLLVERVPGNGADLPQIRLLQAIRDERLKATVSSKAIEQLAIDYQEQKQIFVMNEFAWRSAKMELYRKKIDRDAVSGFLKAYHALKKKPEWSKKYQLETSSMGPTVFCEGEPDQSSIEPVNLDFPLWDPGRFIEGAVAGTLVPYDPSAPYNAEDVFDRPPYLRYADGFLAMRKARSRRRKAIATTGPGIDRVIEDGGALFGDKDD